MPQRVSPTDRVRGQIDELFASCRPLPEILEEVARLGAQLLMQAALEAEVDRVPRPRPLPAGRGLRGRPAGLPQRLPGRDRQDDRRAGDPGPAEAARHHRGVRVAAVRRRTVTKSNALESLVIAGFVRGLSVRDVENTLAEALGDRGRVVASRPCRRVCQAIGDEFAAWSTAPPGRHRAGLPVPGRLLVQDAPRLPAPSRCWRRGASPPPASRCSSAWPPAAASPPTPGPTSSTTSRTRGLRFRRCWSSPTARAGLIAADRVRPSPRTAPALPDPPLPQLSWPSCPAEDAEPRCGRLLGALRHRGPERRRPGARAASWSPPCNDRIDAFAEQYARDLPGRGEVPAHRPRTADRYLRFPPSTTTGSGTPTSSNAPSARPAAASKSSAACPARPAASTWSGPSWTAPPAAGAA